jgi:hypothetical protein
VIVIRRRSGVKGWGNAVSAEMAEIATDQSLSPPSGWDKSTLRGLREIVAEDRGVNGNSWLNPATQMLAHHRLGEWVFAEQRSPLAPRTGQFVYRILYVYVRNVLGFEVPNDSDRPQGQIRPPTRCDRSPNAEIGDGCKIHQGVTIGLRSDPDATGIY